MTLFPHQVAGGVVLRSEGKHYLGDEPGLGKTRTLIAATDPADRPLVICPAIVRTHWKREFAVMGREPAIVRSYDEIVRGGYSLMRDLVESERVSALVLDEAHYLKHASSERTRIILGKNGYARRIAKVFPASGTPFPKNPAEFYTVMAAVFPEVLLEHGISTFDQYVERFCVVRNRYVRGKMVPKYLAEVKNVEEFRAMIGKVMLRRTLADVGMTLPPIWWQQLRLDPIGEVDPLLGVDERMWVLIEAGDLEAIERDPHTARVRRRIGELKAGPVGQMLVSELADSEEKVVVFAHHRSVLASLQEMLRGFGVSYVDGDVGGTARDSAIDRFQTDPRCRVFLGQNIACQTGITLTAARRVVLVEPDWTGDVNLQLAKRVARIGQLAGSCIAQMATLAGTIDEAIVAINRREAELAAETLGGGVV